jgi:hypothetical protein
MFVFPTITAPAVLSRATATASSVATKLLYGGIPHVVGSPAMLNDSLTVIGTPRSGPPAPGPLAVSASRAAVRARSKSRTEPR